MKPDSDFNKQFDLEPAEYSYQGKREPAFGPGALPLVILFVLGLIIIRPVGWMTHEALIMIGVVPPDPSAASLYPYWLPLPPE